MLHPIFSTVVSRPDLVVDHITAYIDLAAEEASSTGTDLIVRLLGLVLGGVFLLLALGLAGVAVMLGALHGGVHWILVTVPLVAALLAVIAVVATRRPPPGQRFAELRRQFAADLGLLRTSGGSHGH